MFPPTSVTGTYGQEGGQNLFGGSMGSMYTGHGHGHMLPYNSYSAQLSSQPTSPSPSMWQPATPHTALTPSTPTADQTFSSSLCFNSTREPYLQSTPQSLQSPIGHYPPYNSMNTAGMWRTYDSLQGIASE